mgnify:CR=1 FL=1
MQDFQKKVMEEKKDLDIKIEKLDGFIRCNEILSKVERMRLLEQLEAMRWYTRILSERIVAFNENVERTTEAIS